jgi:hypothetical protein
MDAEEHLFVLQRAEERSSHCFLMAGMTWLVSDDDKQFGSAALPEWLRPQRALRLGDEQLERTDHSNLNEITPSWWDARHQGSAGAAVWAGGWWTCCLPTMPTIPPTAELRNVELVCGAQASDMPSVAITTAQGEGISTSRMSAAALQPSYSSYSGGVSVDSTTAFGYCQVVYSVARLQTWGTSPTSLHLQIAFIGAIAVGFFASMVYIIASPAYHRKMVSLRLARKFDELEEWVAGKELTIHARAEGGRQGVGELCLPHQEDGGATAAAAQHRKRLERLASGGIEEAVVVAQQSASQRDEARRRRRPTTTTEHVSLSSSSVLFRNPARRTLGELLEDSRSDKSNNIIVQMGNKKNRHESIRACHHCSAISTGGGSASSLGEPISLQDRQYWAAAAAATTRAMDAAPRVLSTPQVLPTRRCASPLAEASNAASAGVLVREGDSAPMPCPPPATFEIDEIVLGTQL